MKKNLCMLIILVLIGTTAFSQEAEENSEQPAQQDQQALPGDSNGDVKLGLGLGSLDINGMVLVGGRFRTQNQEGWARDGNWAFEGFNAVWEENRADLYLNYSFMNFGAFLGLRAQSYIANIFGNGIIPRYAFVYANLGPAKLSIGKLYDELLSVPGSKVWKTPGPGESHRFTDEDSYSIRLEVKPIEGLNVGAQFFFPNEDFRIDNGGAIGAEDLEAWKEVGLGASYTSSLFDIQAGVRFDSNVDRFSRLDTGPQGLGTYLDLYYGSTQILTPQVPAIAAYSLVELVDGLFVAPFKHMDKIIKFNFNAADPTLSTAEYLPYDGGTYAFFGFDLKVVENLTALGQGALYNLGAFDEFGYGRFSEFVKYSNIIPRLGAGIIMQQEFYGSDVFKDTKEVNGQTVPFYNSPFFQFGVQVSYDIITVPGMPIPMLQGAVEANYGVCEDVLDTYIKVKPSLAFSLGTLFVDLYYDMEYIGYSEKSYVKPRTKHTIGLAMMLLF
jgi:hypothetical protein